MHGMETLVYVCMCICVFICMCICVCVCVYTYMNLSVVGVHMHVEGYVLVRVEARNQLQVSPQRAFHLVLSGMKLTDP